MNKITILVADDDPDIRGIISSTISLLGFEVLEAFDGDSAVKAFDANRVDLAVLDIMMPGLNGNQVCEHIKRSASGPFIPVIMLTARTDVQDKVSSFEIGADDYVTKPFNYQELQARVKALLRIRELNLKLQRTNDELKAAQEKILEQERQLLVGQLAGTAAHQLGQPLSAIMLNCHLLGSVQPGDQKFQTALMAVKSEAKRMADLIENLKNVDAGKREGYYGKTDILEMKK